MPASVRYQFKWHLLKVFFYEPSILRSFCLLSTIQLLCYFYQRIYHYLNLLYLLICLLNVIATRISSWREQSCYVLFTTHPQSLECCLTFSKCSLNIFWEHEWRNYSFLSGVSSDIASSRISRQSLHRFGEVKSTPSSIYGCEMSLYWKQWHPLCQKETIIMYSWFLIGVPPSKTIGTINKVIWYFYLF